MGHGDSTRVEWFLPSRWYISEKVWDKTDVIINGNSYMGFRSVQSAKSMTLNDLERSKRIMQSPAKSSNLLGVQRSNFICNWQWNIIFIWVNTIHRRIQWRAILGFRYVKQEAPLTLRGQRGRCRNTKGKPQISGSFYRPRPLFFWV